MFTKSLAAGLVLASMAALSTGAAAQSPHFLDEFEGTDLGSHWEVLNEDPDSYVVEDGTLLALATGGAKIADGTVANIFRMKDRMPEGDWVATIQYSMPYQTGRETPFLGIYDDKDNFFVTYGYAWSYYEKVRGARMFLGATKAVKGKTTAFNNVVWGGAKGQAFTMEDLPNPFVLRITKKGRSYTPALRLSTGAEETWKEFQTTTMLREKGSLAFGIYQWEKVDGETPMIVDWVKVETTP